MKRKSCRDCVYAVPMRDGRRRRIACTNRPGRPGTIVLLRRTEACRNWRRRRPKPVRTIPPEPPNDEVRYIPLTQGKFAIVDAADYERLSRYKWCATRSGRKWYACRRHKGRMIFMHRFLMNPPKGMVVDHIDGGGLNNRRGNMRICTQQQNIYNSRPKGKTSKYKGVTWDKNRRQWIVLIRYEGRSILVGRFDDEIEAAKAYDRKAFELFGEFAWLNFPEEIPGVRPRTE